MNITLECDGPFPVYIAEPPTGVAVKGGLVLIHEIWGLVPHITDIADRYAAEGYVVIAPDILGRVGVTPQLGAELAAILSSPDEAVRTAGQPRLREALAPMRAPEYAEWAVPALTACVDWLAEQPGVDGRLAVTGFCFGGSYSFALAAADSRIRAAIPFYGSPPESASVDLIDAAVLALYGQQDTGLITTLPDVTAAMQEAGVDFTSHVYPGVGHAFFNDTNTRAYDAATAVDAWHRSLAFLDAHLTTR